MRSPPESLIILALLRNDERFLEFIDAIAKCEEIQRKDSDTVGDHAKVTVNGGETR